VNPDRGRQAPPRRLKILLVRQEDSRSSASASGLSTIDAIRRSKPDLVFLDVQMPSANGFEVVPRWGGLPLSS
jgi:two-component system LytT family response regulator